ncbi:MAG: polysaccharide deacetylase family protein [Clostridia bacterium]|nr:polysaccharide deacetylase family protein [Clostridia bacterium]
MKHILKAVAAVLICAVLSGSVGIGAENAANELAPVRGVCTDSKYVALTFDDGPHPRLTEEIVRLLNEYDIKATFFVIGQNAELYPETLRMVAAFGHEIGNHTYSHSRLIGKSYEEIRKEIDNANDAILTACGVYPSLFRPPEGYCGANVLRAAKNEGCRVILWNVDTRDWAHTSEKDICANVRQNVCCGSVILFHDYTSGNAHTIDALKSLIPYLIDEGYSFCTVSELMQK